MTAPLDLETRLAEEEERAFAARFNDGVGDILIGASRRPPHVLTAMRTTTASNDDGATANGDEPADAVAGRGCRAPLCNPQGRELSAGCLRFRRSAGAVGSHVVQESPPFWRLLLMSCDQN